MKKTILLFAMLIAVVGVQAKTDKLYANFASVTGNTNVEWDAANNKLKVWGSGLNTYQMFSFSAGTLSNYKKIHINIADKEHTRILFMAGSETVKTWIFVSTGEKNIELTSIDGLDASNIATITEIRIGGTGVVTYSSSSPCEISINPAEVWLETAEYEGMDITSTLNSSTTISSPFQWYTSTNGTTKTKATGSLYQNQFERAGIKEIISKAGSSLGYGNGFFDITGYDNVNVKIDSYDNEKDNQIRLLLATAANSTTNFNVDITAAGTTTKSLSGLTTYWLSGIYTKQGNEKSQAITSIAFTKNFNAEGTTAFAIAASTSSNVAYDRTFTVGQDATVCLPFALIAEEAAEAGDFYEFTGVSGKTLTFTKVTSTTAYKPYIFKAKTANPFANLTNKAIEASADQSCEVTLDGYTFKGTLAHQNVPTDAYGFSATDGSFVKATSSAVTINAFRAYITSTSGARSLDVDFGDGTTGIEKVKNVGNKYDSIYNLSGQSVSPNYKGIVIKNGKKMIQK